MFRIAIVLLAAVVLCTSSQSADKATEGPSTLERKLHGRWNGPACGGNWTFAENGTFAVERYSPGNNKLAGNWKLRWDALPPTIVLTLKSSDAPERIKVGDTWEVKLIQLDDEALGYIWPKSSETPTYWHREMK